MTERNSKTYLLAAFLAAVGLGLLIYLGLTGSSLEVYSVGELLAAEKRKTDDPEGKELIQVYGRIKSITDGTRQTIQIQDWDDPLKTMDIHPQGQATSGLKPGQDVFATGTCRPQSRDFTAKEIITTCPAKYEARRPQE